MPRLAELHDCDGFEVDAPEGVLGTVEETRLDLRGRPVALVVRTARGRLLLSGADVEDVDLDARAVLVRAGARPLELGPAPAASRVPEPEAETERPVWRTLAVMLAGLVTLVTLEIGAAFLAAYLSTGRPY